MKLGLILAYLILYVAHTQSQDECRGSVSPADPKCIGDGNAGHTYRPSCLRNANNGMWFYDLTSGFCKKLSYQGCGGLSFLVVVPHFVIGIPSTLSPTSISTISAAKTILLV
ncbi:hypothetical protein ACLKA7_016295 [Drosophila subpalustris]